MYVSYWRREAREPLALFSGHVDEQVVRRDDVRNVERLVGEAGERALGQRDELDGHVDVDDRHRRVDSVLDGVEVPADVLALADAVHDGGEPDGEVRRHGFALARPAVRALRPWAGARPIRRRRDACP